MPVPFIIDSFQHQSIDIAATATGNVFPLYAAATGAGTTPNHGGGAFSFDTSVKRTTDHTCSLHLNTSAAAAFLTRTHSSFTWVGSCYVRMTAAPSAASNLFMVINANGNGLVTVETNGTVGLKAGAGTKTTSVGTITDSNWHRIDFKYDSGGASATMDGYLDGVKITQSTNVQTAVTNTGFRIGDNGAATFEAWYSDFVMSQTVGDFPIGDHICLMSDVNGEGTDNLLAHITDQATGTTNLYQNLDPFASCSFTNAPATYVRQTTIDANAYAEFTLARPLYSYVWGVQLLTEMATLSSATASTSGAKLIMGRTAEVLKDTTVIDESVSATALTIQRATAALSLVTGADFSDMRVRWGFSGDITPNPLINAAAAEYVALWPEPNLVTPDLPMIQAINHRSPI